MRESYRSVDESGSNEDVQPQIANAKGSEIPRKLAWVVALTRNRETPRNLARIIAVVLLLHVLDWLLLSLLLPYPFNYPVPKSWLVVLFDWFLGPIVEESVFRLLPIYLALKLRARRRHLILLGIVTSVLFALFHKAPYAILTHSISGGGFFALFFINRRSYASPIVAHALYNLVGHLIAYAQLAA